MLKILQFPCDFLREEKKRETRRKAKQLMLLTVLVLSLLLLLACSYHGKKDAAHQRTVFAMDTVITLQTYGRGSDAAQSQLEQELHRMDNAWTRTRDTSRLSQLNRAQGTAVTPEEDIWAMLTAAQEYARMTNGAFDLTVAPLEDLWGFPTREFRIPKEAEIQEELEHVGMEHVHLEDGQVRLDPGTVVDLGGIAKGCAAEKAQQIFQEAGIVHGFANLGGDVMLMGGRPDHTPWRVSIQDPSDPSGSIGTLTIDSGYVLTSGDYQRYFIKDGQRYHHILDPNTGHPASSDLRSVTIVAGLGDENGRMSDALSTALFVMGEQASSDFWRAHSQLFEMILVTKDGRVVVSPGLQETFHLAEKAGYTLDAIGE